MKITVLSDDKASKQRLVEKHSFSLYIERDSEIILFDLGVESSVLEVNTAVLGLDLDIVDYAIVSHAHTPHYGGFKYLSQEAPFVTVYIPFGTMESLGYTFRANGLKPVEVVKWIQLGGGVYLSKPYYGPPYEHFLVFDYNDGLIVVTGCLHPGVDALIDISSYFKKRIKGVIGGLHLYNAPEEIICDFTWKLVEKVNPDFIIPLHCSGRRIIDVLRKTSIKVLELKTGDSITL